MYCRCPSIGIWVIRPPVPDPQPQKDTRRHPRRSFRCRSKLPCDQIGQLARWSCWWLSKCPSRGCIPAGVLRGSTPDDYLVAGPDRRMSQSGARRVDRVLVSAQVLVQLVVGALVELLVVPISATVPFTVSAIAGVCNRELALPLARASGFPPCLSKTQATPYVAVRADRCLISNASTVSASPDTPR